MPRPTLTFIAATALALVVAGPAALAQIPITPAEENAKRLRDANTRKQEAERQRKLAEQQRLQAEKDKAAAEARARRAEEELAKLKAGQVPASVPARVRPPAAAESTAAAPATSEARWYDDPPVVSELRDEELKRLQAYTAQRVGKGVHFRDAYADGTGRGPEMAVIPAGRFTPESPQGERDAHMRAGAPQTVAEWEPVALKVTKPYALGRREVTRAEFGEFVKASGYAQKAGGCEWDKPGIEQREDHPVVCVSWEDAKAYVEWLAGKTKQPYKLASEVQWEYGARGGKQTAFWWGEGISPEQANYNGNYTFGRNGVKGKYLGTTTAAGTYGANVWGLWDVHGNAWEWVGDCFEASYGNRVDERTQEWSGACSRGVLRGGSWFNSPGHLRSATRDWIGPDNRSSFTGFRLARTF